MPHPVEASAHRLDPATLAGSLLVTALYGAALSLPTYYDGLDDRILPGWETLLLGFIALNDTSRRFLAHRNEPEMWWTVGMLLSGILPNLLLGLGWTFLLSGKRHVPWTAGCAALLGATLWVISFTELGEIPPVFVGFGFWLASMACLVAAGAWRDYRAFRNRSGATRL
jgi:hypothetical protein